MHTFFRILLILALPGLPGGFAHADEIVVIVNRNNTQTLDKTAITRIFLGKTGSWNEGGPIEALDFPEDSDIHDSFYSKVLGKSPALVKTIWAQNIFTGKKLPPRIVSKEGAMKQLVSTNINAIGYIYASQADDSVRVIKP